MIPALDGNDDSGLDEYPSSQNQSAISTIRLSFQADHPAV